MSPIHSSLLLAAILALGSTAFAADAVPDFTRDIRPILSEKCFRCHGPDEAERKGGDKGLRLDTLAGAREDLGGYHAVEPGNPLKSELITRIVTTDEEDVMPPKKTGKTVTPNELELLRRWIAAGAPYSNHWSYEPPRLTEPPAVKATAWPRTPVDRFVLARLESAGLSPQPEADRAALIRRVSLDLTGLPPTVEEVDAFVGDPAPNAYEQLVDRLLARPTYGEHWARSWLDLARYADSKGYADDQPRTMWRYRDYVIDAFNRNLPFDQFTIEQLAGDLLPNPTLDQRFATGFHRNTMNNTEGGTDDEEFRTVAIIDRVNTTFAVWMGSSMACAQCHTHKYDPFTQKEYFQLYAIFNQSEDADRDNEAPFIDFYTDEQKAQRAAAQAELDRLHAAVLATRTTRATPARAWADAFPTQVEWKSPQPVDLRSKAGATLSASADGAVLVAPGKDTDTLTLDVPVEPGQPITALRLEALPHPSLPNGGPGGAKGVFVLTRVRAAIKPAIPYRQGRYIRVELPGKDRILALAEVQVWSEGRNVAPGGIASQPSTAGDAAAARAIDGNTDGDLTHGSVSLTETAETAWWEVDLKSTVPVERVVLFGRTGADSTPGQLKVTVLDEARRPVWELTQRDAPRPSREYRLDEPIETKLARAHTSYAAAEHDEALVITDSQPKNPNLRKRSAVRTGWGNAGATGTALSLTVEPEKPLVLQPGERLIVTLEQQSLQFLATLNHFRLSVASEPRMEEILRTPDTVLAALRKPESARSEAERDLLLAHYAMEVAPEAAAERQRRAELRQTLADMPIQWSLVMRDLPADQHRRTHVQLRGNFRDLGEEVTAGVPAAFPSLPAGQPVDRLALARWLVSPDNPLTARVQVNRLWEAIFGIGLVRTTEEFGSQGELPTHPELLDWLALDFIRHGWDQKRFLRQLVTSAAYRQSSRVTPEALAADPENRLVSRGPRFRLTAEMVRDQALAVSGLLNSRSHGPSSRPFQPSSGLTAAFGGTLDWKVSTGDERLRRGLYTEWRRSSPYPSMVAFDAPNREVCTLRRDRSNTPLQALVTLNDPVYIEAAQGLARILVQRSTAVEEGIRLGFRRVLARPPTEAEVRPLVTLFRTALDAYTRDPAQAAALIAQPENPPPASIPAPTLAAWTTVANVLLNLDETLMKR
ncbi:MAG: DUF1553 domain-containing protein [Opitutaceae bacterium]